MVALLNRIGDCMNKRRRSLLFLCVLSLGYQTSSLAVNKGEEKQEKEVEEKLDKDDQNTRMTKALITLTVTGGICALLNELGSNRNAIKFGPESDASITYGELKFVIGFTGFFWALRNWGIEWAGEIAKKLPIAAASLKLVNWDAFQSIIKKIQPIGKEIGCTTNQRISSTEPRDERRDEVRDSNEDPLIAESQFALRRGLQTIFIYNIAERLLPIAYKKASQSVTNFFRKRRV